MIQFFKGKKENYKKSEHKDGIYFTTDTDEIMTQGKIYGKNADQTKIANDITATSASSWYNVFNNAGLIKDGKLAKGTSLEQIFTSLLCVESYPNVTKTQTASLTTSLSAPTVTLSAPTKSGSLVEVGDTITVSKITMSNTTYGGTTSTIVGTFSNKWSNDDDDKVDDGSTTTLTANRTTPTIQEGDKHSMSVTVTGLTGNSYTVQDANVDASQVYCNSFTGTAVKGTNKVSVTVSGVTYEATVPAIGSKYIVSNLGNTASNKKSPAVAEASLSSTPTDQTASVSLTGVLPVYTTGTLVLDLSTSDSESDSSAYDKKGNSSYEKFSNETDPTKLALNSVTNGTSTFYAYIGFGADPNNNKKIVLLPSGWQISEVRIPSATVANSWITSSNEYATRIKGEGEADAGYDLTSTATNVASKYTKWQVIGPAAASLFKLKITKTN